MSDVRKQTGPEAIRRLEAAADRMEPRIAQAYMDALQRLRDRMPEDELANLVQERGPDAILVLLSSEVIEDAFLDVRSAMNEAVAVGGQTAAEVQEPVQNTRGNQVRFVFDSANPRTAEFAREMTSQRIREVTEDVRQVTQQVITEGVTRGDNPITTARRVRESVGLTRKQQQSVENFRRMLEEGDSDALRRALRDRRFDATVQRLIDGQDVSQDKIDKMVRRYQDRLTKYRSEVIGRTESTRAIQGGQHRFMRQQIEEGRIEERQVRRFWHTSRDADVRSSHRQIPSMNPNGVGQDEPFRTPLGPLMFPGDPSGTAENTIQCRCTVFSRVVSAELLEDSAA